MPAMAPFPPGVAKNACGSSLASGMSVGSLGKLAIGLFGEDVTCGLKEETEEAGASGVQEAS